MMTMPSLTEFVLIMIRKHAPSDEAIGKAQLAMAVLLLPGVPMISVPGLSRSKRAYEILSAR